MGFIGGSPSSSYYFVAAQTDEISLNASSSSVATAAAATPDARAGAAGTTGGASGGSSAARTSNGGGGQEIRAAKAPTERVVYLDPHVVQPVVDVSEAGGACTAHHTHQAAAAAFALLDLMGQLLTVRIGGGSTESYHCRSFRSMKLSLIGGFPLYASL